jgi:hypothetical protein
MTVSVFRNSVTKGCIALALTLILSTFVNSPASAAEFPYVKNAELSLLGICSTSGIDPIPDPSCTGEPPSYPPPPDRPSGRFTEPKVVAVDSYGNEYVASFAETTPLAGRIDVFDDEGKFIFELTDTVGVKSMAIDSEGNLYARKNSVEIVRYSPTLYEGEAGNIEYVNPPVLIAEDKESNGGMAIDSSNNHLFIVAKDGIREYSSAVTGNNLLNTIPTVNWTTWVAIDAQRRRLYVSGDCKSVKAAQECGVWVLDADSPYAVLEEMDGSNLPAGEFRSGKGWTSIAVDEETGHFFVDDLESTKNIYEFDQNYEYVSTLTDLNFSGGNPLQIAISNSSLDADAKNRRFLFVPVLIPSGRVLAFEPPGARPPTVEEVSAANIGESEAQLRATVDPGGADTEYVVEYVTEAEFDSEGFAGAQIAEQGTISRASLAKVVNAVATGLSPGTKYRFRVVAENESDTSEDEALFATFGPYVQSGGCANQVHRTGASAPLPDCRAYELVTPADTASHNPKSPNSATGGPNKWPTPTASPAGDSLAFMVFGGLIPGLDATGGNVFTGDLYVSARTAAGWQTKAKSPNGAQAIYAYAGGLSADHGYAAIDVSKQGTLAVNESLTSYIRYPDGSFNLTGEGSLATNVAVETAYISPGGTHILFTNRQVNAAGEPAHQLEPSGGAPGLYDRTPDGALHPVSILPDGTVASVSRDEYAGVSLDGSAVAFTAAINGPIYLRVDNSETLEATPADAEFAGLNDDGNYLFYVLNGDMYRFSSETASTEAITETGDVDPVNVGEQGTGAYFLSPSVLSTGPNPNDAEPQPGAHNLYHWDDGTTRFVATVTERDADGEVGSNGLGLWLQALNSFPGRLSSRVTADGAALLFESRADLADFNSSGKAQIYRYDADGETLQCVSCSPTGTAPTTDARLATVLADINKGISGITGNTVIPNLSPDGSRAFFESRERLAVNDNDGLNDVYQWEALGKGNCAEPSGCLNLISSGQSSENDHLFGVSRSGDDVFIITADLLVAEDKDETLSVYDARIGGGFAPPTSPPGECLGEACLPTAVPPDDSTPGSASYRGYGNVVKQKPRCGKGTRRVRSAGKVRCVRTHKRNHKTTGNRRKGRTRAGGRAHR